MSTATDKEKRNWSHLINKNQLSCLGNITNEELQLSS